MKSLCKSYTYESYATRILDWACCVVLKKLCSVTKFLFCCIDIPYTYVYCRSSVFCIFWSFSFVANAVQPPINQQLFLLSFCSFLLLLCLTFQFVPLFPMSFLTYCRMNYFINKQKQKKRTKEQKKKRKKRTKKKEWVRHKNKKT